MAQREESWVAAMPAPRRSPPRSATGPYCSRGIFSAYSTLVAVDSTSFWSPSSRGRERFGRSAEKRSLEGGVGWWEAAWAVGR